MNLYTRIFEQACSDINTGLMESFLQLQDEDFLRKTHLFNGRYENLYLAVNKIPQLEIIVKTAVKNAAEILEKKEDELAYGFWLNLMNDGDVTTAHTHDDDDELLSCVYYVNVPENSGDLVIIKDNERTVVKPVAGAFVYFTPDTLHEVTENQSGQSRLSIAFNFGLKET